MTLPVCQIVWRRVAWWLVDNRLEMIWKDAIWVQLEVVYHSSICLEWLKKTKNVRIVGHKAEIWTRFSHMQNISCSQSGTMVD
jgi:hypothetical protein